MDTFIPEITKSTSWKHWQAVIDWKTCPKCLEQHGKIYAVDEIPSEPPPLHENCRCVIIRMGAILPGGATKNEKDGADYWLANYGCLPDYYNDDGHLPSAPGRIWYEADINYYEGYRNLHRILYSSDGLIFVTYDHYATFYEVLAEG